MWYVCYAGWVHPTFMKTWVQFERCGFRKGSIPCSLALLCCSWLFVLWIQVSQYVHAMKMGWMKPMKPLPSGEEEEERPKYYNIWSSEEVGLSLCHQLIFVHSLFSSWKIVCFQSEISKRIKHHIPAPKLPLPGHAESYNPPPEYLFTEEEVWLGSKMYIVSRYVMLVSLFYFICSFFLQELAWKDQEPEERRQNFIPKKYSSLRLVPAYQRFTNERFERCLDLYLCPRQRKMRVSPNNLMFWEMSTYLYMVFVFHVVVS